MGTICKIDSCDLDASDAPQRGPTAKLCVAHRIERSRQLTDARKKPAPEPKPAPAPLVVPDGGDGGTLAELARELEDARADVNRANSRWLDAIRAFKAHDVIQQIGEDVAA